MQQYFGTNFMTDTWSENEIVYKLNKFNKLS